MIQHLRLGEARLPACYARNPDLEVRQDRFQDRPCTAPRIPANDPSGLAPSTLLTTNSLLSTLTL